LLSPEDVAQRIELNKLMARYEDSLKHLYRKDGNVAVSKPDCKLPITALYHSLFYRIVQFCMV